MKFLKTIFIFSILLIVSANLFAERTSNDKNDDNTHNSNTRNTSFNDDRRAIGISAGYTRVTNSDLNGGHFEFSFPLLQRMIYVDNRIMLRAGGLNIDGLDSTVITISEKLVFGRDDEDFYSTYIYLEGGIGFYGNSQKGFSGDTLTFSFGFGGGFEFGDFEYGSVYFEAGYLAQTLSSNFITSGIVLQFGWRMYL
ncbi:MAG: hypothetical protein FWD28_03485 [Treponema sp.]|nr:hypothetical protein [Treponema sp.]